MIECIFFRCYCKFEGLGKIGLFKYKLRIYILVVKGVGNVFGFFDFLVLSSFFIIVGIFYLEERSLYLRELNIIIVYRNSLGSNIIIL